MTCFTYNLFPDSKHAVVSIATKGEYFDKWEQLSAPSWKRWANRHGVAIVVFYERLSEEGGRALKKSAMG